MVSKWISPKEAPLQQTGEMNFTFPQKTGTWGTVNKSLDSNRAGHQQSMGLLVRWGGSHRRVQSHNHNRIQTHNTLRHRSTT